MRWSRAAFDRIRARVACRSGARYETLALMDIRMLLKRIEDLEEAATAMCDDDSPRDAEDDIIALRAVLEAK